MELDPPVSQSNALLNQERESVDAAVERKCICNLYTRGRTALAGSFVIVLVTTGYLLHEFPPLWPAVWLGTQAVIAALRFGLIRHFERCARMESALTGWLHLYMVGSFAGGLAWGAIAAFYPHASPDLRVFIVMVLIGIGAGGITTGGVNRACTWLFLVPELLPLVWILFADGSLGNRLLGGLLVLYLFMLLMTARQFRRVLLESLCLVEEKSLLAKSLEQLNTRIEHERDRYATQALSDPLTGLPNRAALEQQLVQADARARRNGQLFAVGMLDLDDFKRINDAYGHATGDELLKQVASRFESILRTTDFIARLGGDEFVILFDGFHGKHYLDQLRAALDRLHQVVEAPFDLGEGRQVQVGMSMGLAINNEGGDVDTLLRQADVAMYQIKQHKADCECWWRISGLSETESQRMLESPIDTPFGSTARALLADHAPLLKRVVEGFSADFYPWLETHSQFVEILACMDKADHARVQVNQVKYLLLVLSPEATRVDLIEHSRELGYIYAHVGISNSLLSSAFLFFKRLMPEHLTRFVLLAGEHARLMRVINARSDLAYQTQLDAMDEIRNVYFTTFEAALPEGIRSKDAVQAELERLGSLPGIKGALLLRSNVEGRLVPVQGAGEETLLRASLLERPEYQVMLDPNHPQGGSLGARAWRELRIQTVAAYTKAPGTKAWQDMLAQYGVRSVLAIPIRDLQGRAAAVITIYGAYPHQFSSSEARFWSQSLQYRWEMLWQQHETNLLPIPAAEAAMWRERLFGGGFALYLQPIVDLVTGRMIQVEGLARLILPDGRVIAPGQFLPLLSASELYRLFRRVLDQALDLLDDWQARGLDWSVSINLPPSSLLEPDMVSRFEQRLQSHAGAPARLILEVLEWENLVQPEQEVALHALNATGVRLALDDLGAGYASLFRSIRDPLDMLKVDRDLVQRLPQDPIPALTLLWTLIHFARDLDRDLVIEGLETPALIEVVQQLGASLGQGYALARPMPAPELLGWVEGFMLAAHPERITTFAGALARHWVERHTAFADPFSYTTCPITAFLKAQGLDAGEPGQWHRCVHAGGKEVQDCSRHLFNWMVVKTMEEGTGANEDQ